MFFISPTHLLPGVPQDFPLPSISSRKGLTIQPGWPQAHRSTHPATSVPEFKCATTHTQVDLTSLWMGESNLFVFNLLISTHSLVFFFPFHFYFYCPHFPFPLFLLSFLHFFPCFLVAIEVFFFIIIKFLDLKDNSFHFIQDKTSIYPTLGMSSMQH